MSRCFLLNSVYSEISNNKYIFNNLFPSSTTTTISYGLYDTSNNINYIIRNVSKNYPLTFYNSSINSTSSNIITFEPLNKNDPILIYVSKGQDYSFNNNDYFRFYDTSFQLLNINHYRRELYDSSLTDIVSNFYFMNNQRYKFIATTDFCSNQPFRISGNLLGSDASYRLTSVGASFEITIPSNASNIGTQRLYYSDINTDSTNDICGNLFILRDVSYSYYYGDISFSIKNYNDFSSTYISVKSYDYSYSTVSGYGTVSISNNNLFYYSDSCSYITQGYSSLTYELLNKISAVDLSVNANNTFKVGLNKNRHISNSTFNYNLRYGLTIKDYIIIDICKNYPLRLLNNEISNNIYIDETYQINRIGIHTIGGLNYYYGSLKIKVVGSFIQYPINVEFISISNNSIDFSYILTLTYENSNIPDTINHIVYDSSSNSISYYDFSNSNLLLQNQNYVYYELSNYDQSVNKFRLNLNTDYNEVGYSSRDKLKNDLTQFVSATPSVDEINNELSNNFLVRPFYIYYNVLDYENNSIQNIREIELNSGPIIEISNNYNNNNNSIFTIPINTNSNTNASIYNFYDDIKVYIYDTSKNKIFIPFEITISGSYFQNNTTEKLIINYFFNNLLSNAANQYYSTFFNNITINTDRNEINLKNIELMSISVYNITNVLVDEIGRNNTINNIDNTQFFIKYSGSSGSDICLNSSNLNLINGIRFKVNNEFDFNSDSTKINNSLDSSFIVYKFTYLISNPNKSIDISLGLSPTKFFFTASDNLSNSFTVSGNFVKPKIFKQTSTDADSSFIDLQNIGNYNLIINTKSLATTDYYKITYANKFFSNSITNISKTYKISVQDYEPPSLTFYDISGRLLTNLTYFKLFYPRIRLFNTLNDICFAKLTNFLTISNDYIDNKPVLLYEDNSTKYNLSINELSYNVIIAQSLRTIISNDVSDISLINFSVSDASCIINYRVRDLCYNYSSGISLELNFVNIPDVILSGQSIVTLNYINDLSYSDQGLTFSSPRSTYTPSRLYKKITPSNELTDFSFITIGSSFYNISGTCDICFTRLGNYYFKYTIQESNSTHVLRLQRLIKIVDNSKPYIIFPDLSFIIDGSAGSLPTRYNTISNSRITVYNIDNSVNTKIDLSFTVNTNINDVSRVLYNFDLCDNYFSSSALSYTIKLANNPNAFALSDINDYCDICGQLNKVTYPDNSSNINYLPPLTFVYTLTDGCGNSFTFNRRVDIVDEGKPTISFTFNNIYSSTSNSIVRYRDYSYVQFDSSKTDFSYVAFDYSKSPTSNFDFNQEIRSIILGFDLIDNFGIIPKTTNNVRITLSGSSLLSTDSKIINITNPTDNSNINALFKVIGSNFSLIYDICDNQTNSNRFIRNVKIVEYIGDPGLNFVFGYKDLLSPSNEILNISFGDTSLSIREGIDISVNHYRLTPSDISYDISYIFVNANDTISSLINSISGTSLRRYDPSALIYNLGPLGIGLGTNDFSHNIKYFPVRANRSTIDISNYKILTVTVKNNGPIISFGPNPTINHQSYTPLTDASFIFGVTSYSIYDEFNYYNYSPTISYSGTNFKVILDSSLNVNDPSSGTYSIIYYSKDSNNVDISRIRTLSVQDSQAPVITSICGDAIYLYQESNKVWSLDIYSTYTEYGALVYDSATKRSYYFNNQTIPISTESVYDFSYKILGGIKYSIRYNQLISTSTSISYSPITIGSINTTRTDICYQVIYSILDLCDNEVSDNRIIRIIQNYRPLLYPYIEVSSNSPVLIKYLLRDLSNVDSSLIQINKAIPQCGNIGGINDIIYDLSLSYVNNNSIKIITCEAIKPIVFNRALNSNYIKFELHVKSYDETRNNYSGTANSSFSTYVDYSINSKRVFNSPIDYQPITFTAIDNCQNIVEQKQQSITFYLKIIDTKPPNVTKLTNINFSDPNKLDYPLLSSRAVSELVQDIDYFDTYENSYLNYIKYYKKVKVSNSDASNIVLLDPGININDIVDGSVNFVSGLFESSAHVFSISDISLTYFKDSSYIDVSNILTNSGQYIQNYNVKDNAHNVIDVSRVIVVKSFGPIIRLNYQTDSVGNNYTCYLLQRYEKFIEKEGYVRDFSDIDISFTKVSIDYSNLNENRDGSYIVVYSATNSSNILGTAKRKVEVYSPIVLEKVVSINFVNLITGSSNFNSNSKFSLGNGVYNFDVCANYAFKLVTRDFDTSKNPYDVSNLISLTGDTNTSVNNETYYYGSNVRLTISGDFERCSLKFNPNTSSSRAANFQSYLKNNEFRYFFIYDNVNYFINLQNYYNNLRDPNLTIPSANSFSVDVSNQNNFISSSPPYFTINGLKQDLHLIYGVYRFQQTSYKNFYNPIKFSTTPDGTHNGGVEYTKTVFSQNLPGVSRPSLASYNTLSIYTQITINATTPTILYYYSEKFKNMGGKIVIKNNIVLCKNVTILNSYVITNTTKYLFNVDNTFLARSNEVMRNRIVLNQRFDASVNTINLNRTSVSSISAINICCVTQQNLQYNVLYDLNRHPNRLIFKKYNDPTRSNYILANSGSINDLNYLLDVSTSDLTFYNKYNSYITYFSSIYESSSVIMKANGLNNYDRSLKNLFYNSAYTNSPFTINTNTNDATTINTNGTSASLLNNEIFNYINFFKRNNVVPSHLLVKDFSYAINEFLFVKQAELLNLDATNIYNYSSSIISFLLAPRIKITNIIDNYVMFSLDVNYSNLHFQTFEFLVYSSSSTTFTNLSTTISNDRLFFLNGSLVIANNMLYYNTNDVSGFYDGSSVFNKMYTSSNARETTMQNMVFLNIIDVSLTSSICGITKQNIYNNMYLDESNNFIFHKYNEQSIVNYQVNDANLTLAKTLTENSNNDHYLLDICSNIFYNSFNNDGLTIQALQSLGSNKNYSIAITYKIYDEIDVSKNFNMLDSLYILPLYLNNIPIYRRINNVYSTDYKYNTGSYSVTNNNNGIVSEISINAISTTLYGNQEIYSHSNTISNGLHSNSYIINLNEYFDIDLVANSLQSSTSFTTNTIDLNNLIYTILDISYNNKDFSLYNLESSYNIIFDKLNLTILNSMQIKLFCLYFKLKYLVSFINNVYYNTVSTNNIPYTNNVNIQYYSDLYDSYNILNTSFTSTLSTSTISILYSELVKNTVSLITFYNELIATFKYYNYNIISENPIYRTYILNTNIIDQLVRDINSLVENIDFIILNETSKFEDTIINSDKLIFTSYSDISAIEYNLVSFIELYNKSQITFTRFNKSNTTTTYYYDLFDSNKFINLFDINNLYPAVFLNNFKINLDSFADYFTKIILRTGGIGLSITTSSITELQSQLPSVTTFTQFIDKNKLFRNYLNPLVDIYEAFEVSPNRINYINKTFQLSGSQLLIHSKLSNSINIQINIKYRSYFFNFIDISTILLDIIIPDLTPPVLTFANHDFSFNQNDLVSGSITNVITNLIRDVSYIDIHQSHDLTISNTNYSYYIDITNALSSNNIQNSLVSIELPEIKNTNFITTSALFIDISYIVKDNANNINTIIRKLIINKSKDDPKFYYYKANELEYQKLSNTSLPPPVTVDENITIARLKDDLTKLITIIDPRLALSNSYLESYIMKDEFDDFYSSSILGISVINIYDLSRIKITNNIYDQRNIHSTYDVINNKFIDYFNYTTQGGQELANISKILLDVGTYTLIYISNPSTVTNLITNQYRTLIVNAVEEEKPIITHCCYPKVEYKPGLPDNYTSGSQNSTVMKRVKYIINRNR
jgi:hypothetical protein